MIACLLAWYLTAVGSNVLSAVESDDPPETKKSAAQPVSAMPVSPPGKPARYVHQKEGGLPDAVVKTFSVAWGAIENTSKGEFQWLFLHATKANGDQFRVWLLTAGYPADTLDTARKRTARFILQQGSSAPREFRDRFTGESVLPTVGGWFYLFPRSSDPGDGSQPAKIFPKQTRFLGHPYRLEAEEESSAAAAPPSVKLIELLPDVLVGVPSNTRQKDETRRYDGSEYELVRLTREDFHEMAEAGINCMKVDAEQLPWIDDLNVFYWGIGGKDISFPECLYDSRYLGPALFLDEPAVCTRDNVIRPRLAKDEAFRKALTPQIVFDAFCEYFRHAWQEGAATGIVKGLAARPDLDLGDMHFLQENLFSWETMVSTAAYQLSQDAHVPSAMVFEPPGRVGTRRTLPELDMTYGCQLPVDDPKNFIDIIYGFLRGAARLAGKEWGTSIYGAVDRSDAFWFLSHAYDLGATRFFFWDNAPLACVPYKECLALARNLKMRAENHPHRGLDELKRAAEVAILLPPGYNLGHVHLGKGSLWGVGELNLERVNGKGVKYREVMSNFFTEIERCLRLGVAFDLLWDLPGIQPSGYREIVRIREDGKVEVVENSQPLMLNHARVPVRPSGPPPNLNVTLSASEGKAPLAITARANVVETTAPVYYTFGTDTKGVYHNAMVAWELYGPGEEDYRFLTPPGLKPRVVKAAKSSEVLVEFKLDHPGNYRLRAATVDLAGRSTVTWTPITVTN
jgi:hypothetical protein